MMHVTLISLLTDPSDSTKSADVLLVVFTGLLVIVGFLQIGIIRRQMKLQEILLKQWVNVQDWGGGIRTANLGERIFDCTFSIGNKTPLPLTILSITISACGQQTILDNKNLLAPQDSRPVKISHSLGSELHAQMNKGKVVINVTGTISFLDVLEKSQNQPFGQTCTWTPTGYTFEPYQGTLPE